MTIDINELRRLAEAATPHVGHACKYQDAHWLREGHVDFENADLFIASERPQEDAAFYAAANPATVIELLDRLEAAESDALEQARLNGMGASREAALMAKLEAAEKERDALRAKVEPIMSSLNLSDPAVQKRLAAQWGYVPASDMVAPDLLEALKTLTSMAEMFPSELHQEHPDVVAARSAISKATETKP